PAEHLAALGIPVRQAAAGVGNGLTDHPAIAIGAFVKPHARLNGKTRRHLLVGLRFSSGHPDAPAGDMAVSVSTKAAWHAVGEQIASVTIWVNKTFSRAGQVRLRSRNWQDMPIVDFHLLHDKRDLERLMSSFRRLAALFDVPEMKEAVSDPFPAAFSDKVRQVGAINRKNAILTGILAKLLDGPDALRRLLMRKLIVEGPSLSELLADDAKLEAFVRDAAFGVWHACSTCKMGKPDDPQAVTDAAGRVHRVAGLRVVDASLFPVIPSANIHLTVLMTAEKIADAILSGA
ncbi:MAG: GMC family oxidoreductase, partial [Betaproteobacteria bacterium]